MGLFSKKPQTSRRPNKSNVLYFKVVGSKTSVVNLENQASVVCNAVKDLHRKRRMRNEIPFCSMV